jgi:signal transduction histidine kinase
MRILLAEDEPRIGAQATRALGAAGYVVQPVADGETAWFQGETEDYDLVILDLGMPRMDGLAVLKRWRAADRGEACAAAADVIGRVVAVIGRTPAGARLKWLVDVPGDLQLRIDPDDLAEALGNLIENAARHAESSVIIRTTRQDDDARLEVIDDGPGIPAERLEEVLARGGRLDTSGSGAGLGLAIARDIAEAWDGRLEIRSPAAGLEAVLVLRPATKGPKSAGLRC